MGGQNYYVLIVKIVFWFRKVLVSDDFAESLVGRVDVWGEERHGFVKFGGESGSGVVLGLRGW